MLLISIISTDFLQHRLSVGVGMNNNTREKYIITAGSSYLDIDAYACMVAMAELLRLQGQDAVAYSTAHCNYSICTSLIKEGQITRILPNDYSPENSKYFIVDVSDPAFLEDIVSLDNVIAVYDHHVGFEGYWAERIGDGVHIEFIGAAATLIFRQWKKAGLQDKMSRETAQLLIAAILDNTLNLTSANTTDEDRIAFSELCDRYSIDHEWCGAYFLEVQKNIEANLKSAMLGDVKQLRGNEILPSRVGQLAVWDVERIMCNLSIICGWFNEHFDEWMINIIDIRNNCCYFVCEHPEHSQKIEKVFGVRFDGNIAKTEAACLRKEIIKKTMQN